MPAGSDTVALPDDAQPPVQKVRLSSEEPGQVIEFRTRNSTYSVVPVRGNERTEDKIRGVTVTTDSSKWGVVTTLPLDTVADDVIEVNHPWGCGHTHQTSRVQSIRRRP
jgi:hypothetical protein